MHVCGLRTNICDPTFSDKYVVTKKYLVNTNNVPILLYRNVCIKCLLIRKLMLGRSPDIANKIFTLPVLLYGSVSHFLTPVCLFITARNALTLACVTFESETRYNASNAFLDPQNNRPIEELINMKEKNAASKDY